MASVGEDVVIDMMRILYRIRVVGEIGDFDFASCKLKVVRL